MKWLREKFLLWILKHKTVLYCPVCTPHEKRPTMRYATVQGFWVCERDRCAVTAHFDGRRFKFVS